MTVTVNSKNRINEPITISAPPSKSIAHRLLILASLSDNPTQIICRGTSDDIERTTECVNSMGADIKRGNDPDVISVKPISKPYRSSCTMDAGESGSTLRFLIPVLGALGISAKIKMHGRLPERPLEPLKSELIRHGMAIERTESDILSVSGKLSPGVYTIDGGVSSQFISGLLFALPMIGNSEINITGRIESLPYIEMTTDALSGFGNTPINTGHGFIIDKTGFTSPGTQHVEGDWSGAAFMLCAGALSEAGIEVTGLNHNSRQGDMKVIELLRRFGAQISQTEAGYSVKKGTLKAIDIDAGDIPDLIPILSVIAAAAEGKTCVYNAARLRIKESDRLAAVSSMLSALGADIEESDDTLIINGGKKLHGGKVNGYADHRIVMSAAAASILTDEDVTITDPNAISKSYPDFWNDFSKCGIEIHKEQ